MTGTAIVTIRADESRVEEARQFANKLHLPWFTSEAEGICLDFRHDGCVLLDLASKTEIKIDFAAGPLAHRVKFGSGYKQPIAKAIGITGKSKPAVLDITAGLARDAFVIASLGCPVTMIEASPILARMIDDAIKRHKEAPNNFRVLNMDSMDYMNDLGNTAPDTIYMDPMYPERKKSALVKKDMQLLHRLIGLPDEQTNERLLALAIKTATKRVVVKRPKGAPPIDGPEPTMQISSKKTRYDVYVTQVLQQ